jgi:hypothetical protein
MPSSIIAPVVGSGVSYGLSKLFGGSGKSNASLQNFSPAGFSGGGLTGTFGGNSFNVSPSEARLAAVGGLSGAFGNQADQLAGLRSMVQPGVSDFRTARLAELENSRRAAIGNLRENLQSRRVLGSSFGQDVLSRAESEFGQQRQKVAAESFLQEMEMNNNLLQQEFAARRGQFQAGLDEMNLEAGLASQLSGKASVLLSRSAALEAQLSMLSQQNAAKFYGQMFEPATKAIGKAAGSFFNNPTVSFPATAPSGGWGAYY